MQVAASLKDASEESQDWDAQAAQEVAAALARGANVGALVEKKQQRADFLRSKAERTKDQAAQAEVPSQHTSAFSGVAPVLSRGCYQESDARRVWCFPCPRFYGCMRLTSGYCCCKLTTQESSRSQQLFCRIHPQQQQDHGSKCRVQI